VALFLIGSCCAQSGVKGQVVCPPIGGPGLDIAAAFALGMRARSPPAQAARDPVERIFDFAWGKTGADFDFLSAVPPVGADLVKDVLSGGFGRRFFRVFADRLAA
jgi:hypothetical protein